MRGCVAALSVTLMIVLSTGTRLARADDAQSLAELIDRRIDERLQREGLARVPQADDAEFLRRVCLDLHGIAPTAEQVVRFLDDRSPGKRAAMIDALLADPLFGANLGDLWRNRLLSPIENAQRQKSDRFGIWLAERINSEGWDRTVHDLLTATGTIDENPAATWLIQGRNPLSVADLTDLTSRYFLGIRLNCAQCHDHPFAAWKQEDYWGMAAFFAQIQTPGRSKAVHMEGVQDNPRMNLATVVASDAIDGFQVRSPTFLDGETLDANAEEPQREALARWVISPDNPYFARATVNRLWWHFFGRGLVQPVDDMHSGNTPSHPELLDELSRKLAESGFDLKHLCRAILNSRTYQQTSRPGPRGDLEAELFARMSPKVLSGEQLYDSLTAILGPPSKVNGIDVRLGTRYEFTQSFAGDDADPTRYGRGIPHALRLMNSSQFAGPNLDALVSQTAAPGRSTDDVIDQLFLAILARRPAASEQDLARTHVRSAETPNAGYRELAWALLMTSEFSLNH